MRIASRAASLRCLVSLSPVLGLASWAEPARAIVLDTNFSASSPFYQVNGSGLGNTSGTTVFDLGVSFIPSVTAQVGLVEVGLAGFSNENVRFSIHTETGGEPGAVVATIDRSVVSTGATPYGVDFASANLNVNAGQTYWLTLRHLDSGPDTGVFGVWNHNNTGDTGYALSTSGGAGWSTNTGTTQSFRINDIPEPAALAGLVVAGALTALRRRRA